MIYLTNSDEINVIQEYIEKCNSIPQTNQVSILRENKKLKIKNNKLKKIIY